MNSRERSERNADIVAARERGLGWRVIGQTFHLHPDACRRILREHRAQNPTIDAWDMREDMNELLGAYDSGIEELAMVSAGMEAGSARVRAIKTRLALQRERFALLHEISGHPRLAVLPQERDLQAVARTVIEVLERNGVADEVQHAIADALEASG
jgi:hypothetical protein